MDDVLTPKQLKRKLKRKQKAERDANKRAAKIEKKKSINDKYSNVLKEAVAATWQSDDEINYILHVGKTNSGKTYNAVQRLKEVGSGIYLAPLRLLAWEIFEKLNSEGYNCNLVTGEEQVISKDANFTSSTIEMANYKVKHGVAIIDEAWMVVDKDRGKGWLNAILNLKAKEIHVILNDEALELVSEILRLTGRKVEVKQYEMLQKFKFLDTQFNLNKNMPNKGVFVVFSRLNVLINKMKAENLGYTVSILYGNLPPEVKKKQIWDFIEGHSQILITTDVIGMGINVPCDYLVFLEIDKYDGVRERRLNSIEVKQIAGRAGRYGLSNENAFVSCSSQHGLNFLKKSYEENIKLDKACFGLTYEIFSSFDESATISDRISLFKNVNFIPKRLRRVVQKENTQKYRDVEVLIERYKFDLKTQWAFLTAPMKYNNKSYFERAIDRYAANKILVLPYINDSYSDAKQYEDSISEIELYLNMTRHLNHDENEKQKITEHKELLIEKLTQILLDKKLSHKKKCKLCPELLSLTYPYPYCEDCYESKIRGSYDNYGRW